MGESVISSGELYINGELLGEAKEIEITAESEPYIGCSIKELSMQIKYDKELNKKFRKMLGYISQKRFRKLLYSIGYQRNQVNEIIEVEWKCKKSYNLRDVEYWKGFINEKV